jgi:hypothetical protein
MLEGPREDVVAAIDRLVEELLSAAGVVQPPVDAVQLARKHLGIVAGPKRRGGPEQLTEEQRQWAAAQKISGQLTHALLERLGTTAEEFRGLLRESLPRLFAARLLVPTGWFAEDARALDCDIAALKARYATAAHETVALRLLDLPEPCAITVFDNGHITRRRSNAWPVTRRLATAEQECQEYVSHYSRPHRVRRDGWTAHGWPVHTADWKREIVRSVWDEWG